jgi:hypothetical protein
MLQHYSHIRSMAKQAAIRSLDAPAIQPVLPGDGQRIGQRRRDTAEEVEPKSLDQRPET